MDNDNFNLYRFLEAQEHDYPTALQEIKNGEKVSHWIWYIFPKLKREGYNQSWNNKYFGLDGMEEAKAYLEHPVLGARLREITIALLAYKGERDILDIMGNDVDVKKLKSCMTLFDGISPNDVFAQVLEAFWSV